MAGAALGSKLLFWLEDPRLTLQNLHHPAYLIGGKTIVGALAFGLLTVELIKRYIGLRISTGDLYAVPLALGIAIGRIGCFLTGLSDNTCGTSTNLPWAVNFGDGIPRHPTQLYEILFLLALIPFLYRILTCTTVPSSVILRRDLCAEGPLQSAGTAMLLQPGRSATVESTRPPAAMSEASSSRSKENAQSKDPYRESRKPEARPFLPGDAFKLFMGAYMSFRLLCDFLKPYPHLFLGLGAIQWACVLVLLYYSPDVARWFVLRPQQ